MRLPGGHGPQMGGYGVSDVVDHYAQAIAGLPVRPVGGAFVRRLGRTTPAVLRTGRSCCGDPDQHGVPDRGHSLIIGAQR